MLLYLLLIVFIRLFIVQCGAEKMNCAAGLTLAAETCISKN